MILLRRLKVFQPSLKAQDLSFCFFLVKRWISYLGQWQEPCGHDTGIAVYNAVAGKKVPLTLKRKNLASWYMCGPTVYAESHIGHASCYVKFDIIRRILENVFSINVILLLGITDIDDKIIIKANEAGVQTLQLARNFELAFFRDMSSMRVLPPTAIRRVSENIPQIISFCEKLIQSEFAYVTSEGNVYFKVSKGVTSDILNEIPEETLAEVRTDPLKHDPRDFVLWKVAKPHEPFWESPWGRGRPGWHIECSAMASTMFGSDLDLHSGGYDLLFPHHANEKSQSQAFHECSQWGNYWMHAGLLQVGDDVKMSKSLGNTISIQDFLKEHSVNDFRILCLQSLYRKNLIFCSETLSGAKGVHKKLHHFINECESYICGETKGPLADGDQILSKLTSTKEQVIISLRNDFNTSQALLYITDLIDEVHKHLPLPDSSFCIVPEGILSIASIYFYINQFLESVGINIVSKKKLPWDFVCFVDAAAEFRNQIRLFAANPNDIGLRGDQRCSEYVDNVYKNLSMKLGETCQTEDYCTVLASISNTLMAFHEKVHPFAEKLEQENALQQLKPKDVKRKMSPLFTYCDELRSSLLHQGIEIKDRGSCSSWIPSMKLEKIL